MVYLISDIVYLVVIFCYLAAILLVFEWLVHFLPGALLNPARRALFLASFPLLKFSDQFFSFKRGSFQSRGLLTAILLIVISRYVAPWMVLLTYSLRN